MNLEFALKQAGFNLATDLTINYDVQFDLITASFEGGIGDYCTMFEPGASQYEANGKGYIVASVGEAAGVVPYTCFMSTKNYLDANKDKVAKFMKAIIKGIDFVMNNTDETVATALAPSFSSTDYALLVKSVASYKSIDAYMSSPIMTKADYDHMIDILIASGSLEKRVAFNEIIDNSIAEMVLADQ